MEKALQIYEALRKASKQPWVEGIFHLQWQKH